MDVFGVNVWTSWKRCLGDALRTRTFWVLDVYPLGTNKILNFGLFIISFWRQNNTFDKENNLPRNVDKDRTSLSASIMTSSLLWRPKPWASVWARSLLRVWDTKYDGAPFTIFSAMTLPSAPSSNAYIHLLSTNTLDSMKKCGLPSNTRHQQQGELNYFCISPHTKVQSQLWVHIQARSSVDFDKFLPRSFCLNNPYIHLDMVLNSLVSIKPLTRNLAPRLINLPSQAPVCSWVERSNVAWSALLRGTMSWYSGRVSNLDHDQDPALYHWISSTSCWRRSLQSIDNRTPMHVRVSFPRCKFYVRKIRMI